jgi:16S rRNA (cytidine1402-2'-O)-methyltransferase
MAEVLGRRDGVVARELTKVHEEIRRGTLAELAAHYAANGPPKGEVTLVIGPPAAEMRDNSTQIDALLAQVLPFMPVRSAAQLVADATGASKRLVYNRAIALKGKNENGDVGGQPDT